MSKTEALDDGANKQRVTVSLDAEVANALKPAAERAGARSVSQYVQAALSDRMRRDQWLARWRAVAGEVDPQALEYARRAFLGETLDRQPRAS